MSYLSAKYLLIQSYPLRPGEKKQFLRFSNVVYPLLISSSSPSFPGVKI